MDCAEKGEDPQPTAVINPEITWASEEVNIHEEGCLSIPDFYGDVTRPARVRVKFLDENGEEQEREWDGLWATCVQHEIDHLNGKLFIDYLGPVRRAMITEKMKKLKRQRAKEAAQA
jgi:peptide deformylase